MHNEELYPSLPPWQRTDYCGALRAADAGREVSLWGWVGVRRDHGGLIFIDLRDREGIVQLVFNPELNAGAHEIARSVRSEFYLAARGRVVLRSEGTVNAELPTGSIEIVVAEAKVLNSSQPPPFPIGEGSGIAEEVRLKYRFLDLRSSAMQRNLRRRHRFLRAVRDYLDVNRFVEIETPILWRATPEGARDYLVPSRVNPGRFYALPQSPQLLKQLLMIGGLDRYYQMARCFRDEDLRANRQPEFTQIDIEMTCPRPDDIHSLIEGMMAEVYLQTLEIKIATPFPRMRFAEAMDRYGTDKPDLRFGLEMKDVGFVFAETGFRIFAEALARSESIFALALPGKYPLARRELDELVESVRLRYGQGLMWVKLGEQEWQGPVAKYLEAGERAKLLQVTGLKSGDTLLMAAGAKTKVRPILGEIRLKLGARFALQEPGELQFLWIVDPPMFEYSEQEKRLVSVNHPFTAPHPDCLETLESDPLGARALAYDLVLNGEEVGGGSIRIHNRELQLKVMELLGLSREEAMGKFGFLIDALSYGAPPHGGIAMGVDRIAMLLCGTDSLRDVLAFPKTQRAIDPMSGAPSEVAPEQLRELSIKVTL